MLITNKYKYEDGGRRRRREEEEGGGGDCHSLWWRRGREDTASRPSCLLAVPTAVCSPPHTHTHPHTLTHTRAHTHASWSPSLAGGDVRVGAWQEA